MKIKLSKGKPRGDGLFLICNKKEELELVSIQDEWVFNYPRMNASITLEDQMDDILGWKKLDIHLVE